MLNKSFVKKRRLSIVPSCHENLKTSPRCVTAHTPSQPAVCLQKKKKKKEAGSKTKEGTTGHKASRQDVAQNHSFINSSLSISSINIPITHTMAPKDKKGGKKGPATGAPIQDPRFSHVHRDPRFVKPQKKDSKVTVDSRFSSMLKGKEFSSARTYLVQFITLLLGTAP